MLGRKIKVKLMRIMLKEDRRRGSKVYTIYLVFIQFIGIKFIHNLLPRVYKQSKVAKYIQTFDLVLKARKSRSTIKGRNKRCIKISQ
jgi:hypothetical protein